MSEFLSAALAIVFTLVLCVYAYITDRDRPRAVAIQPAHGEPNPQSTRIHREIRRNSLTL
jgi:hypothetical protein